MKCQLVSTVWLSGFVLVLSGLVTQISDEWALCNGVVDQGVLTHVNWTQLGAVHDGQVHQTCKWDGPAPTAWVVAVTNLADAQHLDFLHTTCYFVCSLCWMASCAAASAVDGCLDQFRVNLGPISG